MSPTCDKEAQDGRVNDDVDERRRQTLRVVVLAGCWKIPGIHLDRCTKIHKRCVLGIR